MHLANLILMQNNYAVNCEFAQWGRGGFLQKLQNKIDGRFARAFENIFYKHWFPIKFGPMPRRF